ncbi:MULTISPECIES: NAD(P)/FAD-dependent oxidoreductase [unclassified Carboxylicivirga]|uniref:NAD(P)/FAD-dependent oxidoreductase n=1 Tax=Carboxylicivirga TaxID=1628153 RepID=UPI003D3556CB
MSKTEHTDILIVGQGLAGTLLSYQLLKKKISHKVVDTAVDGRASEAAAGLINPIVVKRMKRAWQADLFHPYAATLYQTLEKMLETDVYHPMPINKIYDAQDEVFWQQRNAKEELGNYISTPARYDLPKGIHQPYGYGSILPSARLNMAQLLKSYRQYLITHKLLIEANFKDTDLTLGNNAVHWHNINARRIVFCRGAFDAESSYFKYLKWNNTKGELLDVNIKNLSINNILSKGIFVMPTGDGNFKLGATYDHHWNSLAPSIEKRNELLKKWSVLSDLPLTIHRQLTGLRPTLASRQAVSTFLENYPQIGIFNGLGSRGGLMAPYLSFLMSNKIKNSLAKRGK